MFAATEQKILDRLRAKLAPEIHVGALHELVRVEEMRQKAPAVWVIYDGFTLGDRVSPVNQIQQVTQDWFVVVAAKSARGNGTSAAARDEADAMCDTVLAALLGFHLGDGRYLRLQPAPGPEYDGGYAHVPLAFSCATTFRGDPA